MVAYSLYSPVGNITALVSSEVSLSLRSEVARSIMEQDTRIEQVGFMQEFSTGQRKFNLEMMGGELCINGSMAAAWKYCTEHKCTSVTFTTSGILENIRATIHGDRVTLFLPSSLIVSATHLPQGICVELQGIRVLVREGVDWLESDTLLNEISVPLFSPAIVFAGFSHTNGILTIAPLVWVRETQSYVKESACGTGSIALAHVSQAEKTMDVSILQPSGHAVRVVRRTDGSLEYSGSVSSIN